nr:retinoschisin-like [Lytechinus pictus]
MSFCKSLSAILLLSVAYVPANCDPHALGIQSRSIPDTSLTASSEWDALRGPERARLHSQADGPFHGSWVARVGDDKQWIQVDLLDIYHITSVATQGRTDYAQWVTSYKVACSTDGIVFNTVRVNYSGKCTSEKVSLKAT